MDPSHESPRTNWFVLAVSRDRGGDLRGTIESTRGDLHVRFDSGRELLAILSGAGSPDAGSESCDA